MPPTLSTTFSKEFGVQRRGGAHQGSQFGRPAEIVARGHLLPTGSAKSLREENMKVPSPKPTIEELQKWVTWKA